MKHLKIKKRTT